MPRPARRSRDRRPGISPLMWATLNDGPTPEGANPFEAVFLGESGLSVAEAWAETRAEILERWIEESPGTRPSHWWRFEAREPRRRLGGVGTPLHDCLAYGQSYAFGVPVGWLDAELASYYTGQMRHVVTGALVNPTAGPEDFPYPPLDPFDPPRFESEAAYLDRLGLLTREEHRLLTRDGWPDDEVVEPESEEPGGEAGAP